MKFRNLPVPASISGRIWLHAMPGRDEDWPVFMDWAAQAGLTRIVCLTPLDEVAARSPEYLDAIEQGGLPCPMEMLPMVDFGVSSDAELFAQQVRGLAERLRVGESLLLHCAWGIGRTGTVAACLLKALGMETEQALAQVRAAGSNPQSAVQSGWVGAF
jgi:protein-tyrosine phosphatase